MATSVLAGGEKLPEVNDHCTVPVFWADMFVPPTVVLNAGVEASRAIATGSHRPSREALRTPGWT
jgi:hypothetical protein